MKSYALTPCPEFTSMNWQESQSDMQPSYSRPDQCTYTTVTQYALSLQADFELVSLDKSACSVHLYSSKPHGLGQVYLQCNL